MKMKTVGFSKTLVNLYYMTLYHTPEDRVIAFVTMITVNQIDISNWYSEGTQLSFMIMNMNSVSATSAYNRSDRVGTHVPLFSKEQIDLVLGFIL